MIHKRIPRTVKPQLGEKITLFPIPFSFHCDQVPAHGEAAHFMTQLDGHVSSIKLVSGAEEATIKHISNGFTTIYKAKMNKDGGFSFASFQVEVGDMIVLTQPPGQIDVWFAFLLFPYPSSDQVTTFRGNSNG
jgi:hypothetical protein